MSADRLLQTSIERDKWARVAQERLALIEVLLSACIEARRNIGEPAGADPNDDTANVAAQLDAAIARAWVGESGTVRTMRRLCDEVDRLRSQRDAEYARGLEAAARVADADRCGIGCCDGTAESIAARIRALRPTDDGLVVVPRDVLERWHRLLAILCEHQEAPRATLAELDALLKDPR